ncbi:MFS transporter [Serratia sp. DD3]|uniref:MFS transporter n=1 Tax=Serratia sp. DD3 TaxID=1410619 RepID=UPI0003C4EEEF|nr:MFS transporter [Serratia sp. DD3]KEY59352.1 4-hydroxybenzoate transporter PcaK [Serratia sp. DD3]
MTLTAKIDVVRLIDESPIGKFQWRIFILCAICMVLDGFDVQAMSYVAPALLQDWRIDKSSLGPVFGAGLFGLLIGSLLFSMVADKLGRRPVLIVSTFFFGLCMLVTPFASTLQELIAIRFITGLGLGAIMPNSMALCGEFSPKRKRISIMMMISCGFTVGAMLGGAIAAALIPTYGWQSIFYLGGILPLFIAVLMIRYLPESIQFQVLTGKTSASTLVVCKKIFPAQPISHDMVLVVGEQNSRGVPLMALFQDGRMAGTLAIWAISFLNMIALYFLSNWLPTIAQTAGLSLESAVLVGATLQLGGIIGTLAMGKLIDNVGFKRVLVPCFAVATLFIALIGHSVGAVYLLFAVVFITGFAVVGGQPAINAMAASYYPTALRTTGVGWSLGIGRIGSVIGPVVGGQLIGLNWGQDSLFQLVAIPSVVIVLVLLFARFEQTTQANPSHTLSRQKHPTSSSNLE